MKIAKLYSATLSIFVLGLLLADVPAMAQQIKGNGNIRAQDRNVSGYQGLDVSGGFEVHVTQGNNESLRIEADENLLDNVKTEVKNGVLHIYNAENINTKNTMKAYVTLKELNSLDISGGVKVVGMSAFRPKTFKMDLSGASNVKLDLMTDKITAGMSGASQIALTGRADQLILNMSGASKVDAENFESNKVKVKASGASTVKVFAKEVLDINASGASHVRYKGSPSITSNTSGGTRISKL
jgi:hypothetical protein